MRIGFRRGCRVAAVLCLVQGTLFSDSVPAGAMTPPKVYISKYRRIVATDRDRFELSNYGPAKVDLSGWKIRSSGGEYQFPAGSSILGNGGRLTVETPPIVNSISSSIELIDDLKLALANLIDRVRFGCEGGAPAPPLAAAAAALVRAPDPSALPPLAPADDENWWTIDLDAVFGTSNDAPTPALGTSLELNEIRAGNGVAAEEVELYNDSASPVSVDGWFITSASDVVLLSGAVPAFGWLGLAVPGLDIDGTERVDLFDADSVRVDQKSLCGRPDGDPCYGSCPDGAAANDGHDYPTCGGGSNWFQMPCTIGSRNEVIAGRACAAASVDDPPPTRASTSWGRLKTRYEERGIRVARTMP